jgi:hypothetical protein
MRRIEEEDQSCLGIARTGRRRFTIDDTLALAGKIAGREALVEKDVRESGCSYNLRMQTRLFVSRLSPGKSKVRSSICRENGRPDPDPYLLAMFAPRRVGRTFFLDHDCTPGTPGKMGDLTPDTLDLDF